MPHTYVTRYVTAYRDALVRHLYANYLHIYMHAFKPHSLRVRGAQSTGNIPRTVNYTRDKREQFYGTEFIMIVVRYIFDQNEMI